MALELTEILLIITLTLVALMFIFNFEMYKNILFITERFPSGPTPSITLRPFVSNAVMRRNTTL